MIILAFVLLVLAAFWVAAILTGKIAGRAADQGMYVGMLSPKDPEPEKSVERALRHQRTEGSISRQLLRWWPLPVLAVVAAIVIFSTA